MCEAGAAWSGARRAGIRRLGLLPKKKQKRVNVAKKLYTLLDLCVSSLRRGHANLLCIVPILTGDPRRESNMKMRREEARPVAACRSLRRHCARCQIAWDAPA